MIFSTAIIMNKIKEVFHNVPSILNFNWYKFPYYQIETVLNVNKNTVFNTIVLFKVIFTEGCIFVLVYDMAKF